MLSSILAGTLAGLTLFYPECTDVFRLEKAGLLLNVLLWLMFNFAWVYLIVSVLCQYLTGTQVSLSVVPSASLLAAQ